MFTHGVSVIICCHNSSTRLPATLTHFRQQEVASDIAWEVIVVDNASTDNTSEVALRCWPHDTPTKLKVVYEPRLGLSHARQCGLSEAKYEIVSFIDDDNWVSPNWVQLVAEIMSQHPNIGACGGYNEAVCEVTPPWWFEHYKNSYAIGSQGHEAGDVSGTRGFLWGAGLSVRKSAWQQLVREGFRALLVDRKGSAPTAGGDAELSFALRLAGWGLWYDPRLRLRHFLPARRLEWEYLRRLHRGFGASSVWLDLYSYALKETPETLIERLKRTWHSRTLAALVKLLWFKGKMLVSFDCPREGNLDALQVEVRIGRLIELMKTKKTCELPFRTSRRYMFSEEYSPP
jgi:glycosyltransferase involved in cell wall biosynthesis